MVVNIHLRIKLSKSNLCNQLFVAPGNAGTEAIAKNLDLKVTDFEAIEKAVVANDINMVVVGPEDPLVQGISDYFSSSETLKNVMLIGPSERGALLEGSKERAKEFMLMHNIPTAAYESFTKEIVTSGERIFRNAQTSLCA